MFNYYFAKKQNRQAKPKHGLGSSSCGLLTVMIVSQWPQVVHMMRLIDDYDDSVGAWSFLVVVVVIVFPSVRNLEWFGSVMKTQICNLVCNKSEQNKV